MQEFALESDFLLDFERARIILSGMCNPAIGSAYFLLFLITVSAWPTCGWIIPSSSENVVGGTGGWDCVKSVEFAGPQSCGTIPGCDITGGAWSQFNPTPPASGQTGVIYRWSTECTGSSEDCIGKRNWWLSSDSCVEP